MDSNKFYNVFAKYYHKIFPVTSEVVNSFAKYLKRGTMLDVGTGTGEYAAYFTEHGFEVTGIDLSHDMIETAKLRHKNIVFKTANMLEYIQPGVFLNIICLGSTIAHLASKAEISAFIKLSLNNLQPSGVLVIKTLDYSFVLDEKIMAMPTLIASDKTVTLERNYEILNNELYFCTTLKTRNNLYKTKTKLFPVTKKVMEEVLKAYKHTITKHERQLTIVVQK